ncbi:MAG TPA: YhjD/YihY/BrkB family envelope integrity protein [Candidatus Sulfopaludibacter sp.]|nr:YhjD/YihY/BrkB family envelope integrity protein [Candidatus Sulfopaludibacter sp.]
MAKRPSSRLVKILSGFRSDAEKEWVGAENDLNRLERFAHFWVLVARSFVHNRCPVRAAALSYTTLLALIPLLAVAISVTSSLLKSQGEEKIYEGIDKFVSSIMPPARLGTNGTAVSLNLGPALSVALTRTNSETAGTLTNLTAGTAGETNLPPASGGDARITSAQKEAASYIQHFVQTTRSGTLGITGMVLLVFIAIRMLASVEATFNDIWGVTRGRNWLWRTVLYWAAITLGPLLLVAALGLAGGPHLETARNLVNRMPLVGRFVFELLPLVVLWLAFALVYLLMPNTRVRFDAAMIGGMVGGTLWHLNNIFGFLYVSRVVTNSKIYGSLGLMPVFMIGLYFSWLILLFGAQVAYGFQNRRAYLQDKLVENVNQRGREFIALRMMTCIGQRFQRGLPPPTLPEISAELGVPTRLVQQVLQILLAGRLVTEVIGTESAYVPARPLDAINAHHVLQAMRAGFGQELPLRDEPARAEVYGEFARIEEAERQTASSVTLLALVNRLPARPEINAPTGRRE